MNLYSPPLRCLSIPRFVYELVFENRICRIYSCRKDDTVTTGVYSAEKFHTSSHYVYLTTICTEWLHSRPLTDIQLLSGVQYLLRNSTAILFVYSGSPRTHTAQLFMHLICCGCAPYVLRKDIPVLPLSVWEFKQNSSRSFAKKCTDPFPHRRQSTRN